MILHMAICDDDDVFLNFLREMLDEYAVMNKHTFYISEYKQAEKLISSFRENNFSMVFLDIDMPGIDGFKAADELQKSDNKTEIIFVTAHKEYAYQAYDYKPYSFVFKSDLDRLKRMLDKYIGRLNKKEEIRLVLDNGTNILINDIMYFNNYKNNVVGHYENGQTVSIRTTVKNVYDAVRDKEFIYVQRGYIANCRFVKLLNSKFVLMHNGEKVPMTRDAKKLKEAQEIYGKYVRENL